MPRPGPNILLAAVLTAAVVGANALLFDGALGRWAAGTAGRVLAPVAATASRFGISLNALTDRRDAVARALALDERELRLQAREAEADQLRRDLAAARAAAGIRERTSGEPLEAGVFAWPRQGGIRELTVNRGSRDWVAAGDVVITPVGALVGVVRAVAADSATVRALGDPGVEVTARVADTDISGLVRTDPRDGLLLDLVDKNEPVTEGQTVITSGNDRFPAALVIGTVRAVDTTATTLFATVRLDAAVPSAYAGPVLIIRLR